MNETMDINFTYRITYPNGIHYDSRQKGRTAVCKVDRATYIKMVKFVVAGGDFNAECEDKDISNAVELMRERVLEFDRYQSMDGRWLKKPLKKPRAIERIEVFLDAHDIARFKKMGDMDAVFERPEQKIILTRNDGSTVSVTVKDGLAAIRDSAKPGSCVIEEEDRLADRIIEHRW